MEPQTGKQQHNSHCPPHRSKSIRTVETKKEFKEETLKDVNDLLWRIVWRFYTCYGEADGTLDELFSEACFAFVKAYDTYDPSKGAFTTHVYWKVTSHLKTNRRRASRRKPKPLNEDIEQSSKTWRHIFNEISEDALAVVNLVTDTPLGLKVILEQEQRNLTRAGKRICTRFTLREYLSGLGWQSPRIDAAFQEIQEALQ